MAKTRSQTRKENASQLSMTKNKLTLNLKRKKTTIKLKECVVKLDRIKLTGINFVGIVSQNKSSAVVSPSNDNAVVSSKPLNQIVASSRAALHSARAMRMWDNIKKKCIQTKTNIKLNDVVLARMAGFRPWPSVIEKFKKNGVEVRFYGTNQNGIVKKSEIAPYVFCKEMIGEYLKFPTTGLCTKTMLYHASYLKATREVSCIDWNEAYTS